MTAKEKMDVQLRLSRSASKILHWYELKYIDATIMLLGMTYSFIEMFVRNDIAGCKKNTKKCRKIVNKIISDYLEYRLNPDPESPFVFKDDQDGQSDVQE